MTLIKYEKSDLLESPADVIGHGVNCLGAFGAGVALQIANKWPEVKSAYLTKYKIEGWQLGDVQIITTEDNSKKIANLATQRGYGYRHNQEVYVDYESVKKCISKLFKYCRMYNYRCAIPKIGAGLAGGNWDVIAKIIQVSLKIEPIDLTIHYI